jgi:hypothetical protein
VTDGMTARRLAPGARCVLSAPRIVLTVSYLSITFCRASRFVLIIQFFFAMHPDRLKHIPRLEQRGDEQRGVSKAYS